MEPIYENVYTETEEMMLEQYAESNKVRRILYIVVEGILFFYMLVTALLYGHWVSWVACAVLLYVVISLLLLPWRATKKYFKRMLQYHDGVIPQTVVRFMEQEVQILHGSSSFSIPYEKLDTIRVLKHCIVLHAGKSAYVALRHDSFTIGNKQDFMRFINKKCTNLLFS